MTLRLELTALWHRLRRRSGSMYTGLGTAAKSGKFTVGKLYQLTIEDNTSLPGYWCDDGHDYYEYRDNFVVLL